jgi:hypothetical protein
MIATITVEAAPAKAETVATETFHQIARSWEPPTGDAIVISISANNDSLVIGMDKDRNQSIDHCLPLEVV